MRGRVLILVGLIILGGVVIGAVLLLGGGDEEPATTATDTTPGADEGNGEVVIPPDSGGPGPGPQTQPTADPNVFGLAVAVRDLPRGTLITRDMVEIPGEIPDDPALIRISVRYWPEAYVPQTAILDPARLIGCRVRTDIPVESPIVVGQLAKDPLLGAEGLLDNASCAAVDAQFSQTGSDAALGLEGDTVGISVPLDITGLGQVAYALQPGDRVDIIMSFLFIDVDEEFQTRRPNNITVITRLPDGSIGFTEGRPGRPEPSNIFPEGIIVGPSELQQRPRLETQRTITNAKVVWVGWFPPDGSIYGATPTPFQAPTVPPAPGEEQQSSAPPTAAGPSPTAFTPVLMTLGVTPQDALVLVWAIDAQIPITYTLRPAVPNPVLDEQTQAVTLEYILNEFQIDEPPNLPISVEPAITDIRRFDLSSLRTFAELFLG